MVDTPPQRSRRQRVNAGPTPVDKHLAR